MFKITNDQMPKLLSAIAESKDIFLPINNNGVTNFGFYKEDCTPDLETLKTVKSAKDAFFPQSEGLYAVTTEEGKMKISEEEYCNKDFVIFGVRPCDVRSFDVLDKVFLSDPVDTYYAARRAHGIVVSLACHQPEESCFCATFDIDAAEPNADVAMWNIEGGYAWEAKTEKGQALTESVKAILEEADVASEVETEKNNIRAIINVLPNSKLDLSAFGAGKTDDLFNSPMWTELSNACLGCGTCTFSCPTCQCYDIKDFNTGHGVERYRCWDSCMYHDFTLCAHGTNRQTQMQRFRQRFMHKLVYFPDREGMFSCVGCGRCVDKCPQSLNIVKVIKRMGGNSNV